jgi:hypothetical protein
MIRFFSLSPELLSRIDRLSGCYHGRWIVDCRAIEGDYSYALRSLSDHWPIIIDDCQRYWHSLEGVPNLFKLHSLEDAAQYCAATKWQAKLLFSHDYLNADCSWPGGYEASSIHRSNNRTFKDMFTKELEKADGDAYGLALDIRFITEEMLETIESLENYFLISEDDHSYLEMDDQQQAWEDWAERDFRQALEKRFSIVLEDDDKAEQIVESIDDRSLASLFYALSDASNTYWQEEDCHGWWIDCERIVDALSEEEIGSLASPPEIGSLLSPIDSLLASLGHT